MTERFRSLLRVSAASVAWARAAIREIRVIRGSELFGLAL
jgi:hypothetical protein